MSDNDWQHGYDLGKAEAASALEEKDAEKKQRDLVIDDLKEQLQERQTEIERLTRARDVLTRACGDWTRRAARMEREATDYLHAVEQLFAVQPEGDCLAERKPTKDDKAYAAFAYLNDQGKLLRAALSQDQPRSATAIPKAGEVSPDSEGTSPGTKVGSQSDQSASNQRGPVPGNTAPDNAADSIRLSPVDPETSEDGRKGIGPTIDPLTGSTNRLFSQTEGWTALQYCARIAALERKLLLAQSPIPVGRPCAEPSDSLVPEDSGPVGMGPVPEGWKLVPLEPTPEMIKAYKNAMRVYIRAATNEGRGRWKQDAHGYIIGEREKAYCRWHAMCAAAPEPPERNAKGTEPREWNLPEQGEIAAKNHAANKAYRPEMYPDNIGSVAGIPCRFCMGRGSDTGSCPECGKPDALTKRNES